MNRRFVIIYITLHYQYVHTVFDYVVNHESDQYSLTGCLSRASRLGGITVVVARAIQIPLAAQHEVDRIISPSWG